MAEKTFPRKDIYHSALRGLGAVNIAFTSAITESKYPNRPPYIDFMVEGDGESYRYTIENDDIRTLLADLPRDVWFRAEATGSKDTADFIVHDEIGPVVASKEVAGTGARRQASQSQVAAASQSPNASRPSTPETESLSKTLRRCIAIAHDLDAAYEEHYQKPMSDNVRSIAISLSIEIHRRGGNAQL